MVLGISADTADMTLQEYINPKTEDKETVEIAATGLDGTPAWSLGALMNLMPGDILVDNVLYTLCIEKTGVYYTGRCNTVYGAELHSTFESCIRVIEWLVNNGYIKTNEDNMLLKNKKKEQPQARQGAAVCRKKFEIIFPEDNPKS